MEISIVDNDVPREFLEAAIQSTVVGMDIETNGLWPHLGHKIACVQLFVPDYGSVLVRYLDDVPVRLARLLESHKVTKIFQHAEFDLSFLMNEYAFINPHKICDTKIAADVLDPDGVMFDHPVEKDAEGNPKKSHSLIALVWHYYKDLLNKSIATSNWFDPNLTPEQLDYAMKDVIYLPDLLKQLEREIYNKNPLLIHELCILYRNIPNKAVARMKKAA